MLSYDVGGNFGTRNRVYVEFGLVLWASNGIIFMLPTILVQRGFPLTQILIFLLVQALAAATSELPSAAKDSELQSRDASPVDCQASVGLERSAQ